MQYPRLRRRLGRWWPPRRTAAFPGDNKLWQRRAASAGAGCRGSSYLPVSWRWLAGPGVIVARVHAHTRRARRLVRNHTPSVSAARPICTTYAACSRRRKARMTSATCTGVGPPARQLLWRLVVVVAVVVLLLPPPHRSSRNYYSSTHLRDWLPVERWNLLPALCRLYCGKRPRLPVEHGRLYHNKRPPVDLLPLLCRLYLPGPARALLPVPQAAARAPPVWALPPLRPVLLQPPAAARGPPVRALPPLRPVLLQPPAADRGPPALVMAVPVAPVAAKQK